MAPAVNATSIRHVRIGMNERQVQALLGAPIRVRPWGPDSALHDYAVRGTMGQGIAVWIHIRQHVVAEVEVTQHFLVRDSRNLYLLRPGEPAYERGEFTAALARQ